jgi:hypothetical protein
LLGFEYFRRFFSDQIINKPDFFKMLCNDIGPLI